MPRTNPADLRFTSETRLAPSLRRIVATMDQDDHRSARRQREEAARARPAYQPPERDPRDHREPPPELVRERLRRGRVVPVALTRTCPACGAPSGTSCIRSTRAVCGARIRESRA